MQVVEAVARNGRRRVMHLSDAVQPFLYKARESLAGAESELANYRYNNAANRAYYAVFQASIAALQNAGVQPEGQWRHEFVHGEFEGRLIYRRKLYPTELRGIIERNRGLRRA